ncbi:IS3 family transposase [Streptomyces sp. NPDC057236]|uniref:IS3 family transposase n=1 Tax=Streptomyces sp. NPDC057236 TaxID=3346059 RepID=UPI00363A0C08
MTALVDEHPHLGVEPVLRELHIPSSTYYRWRQAEKKPCERRRQDAELTGRTRQVHDESGGIYGSPRVHAVLKREGVHVGRKRVERLMRQAGLAGISPRRGQKLHDVTRTPILPPIWCNATSPRTGRTGCGPPT